MTIIKRNSLTQIIKRNITWGNFFLVSIFIGILLLISIYEKNYDEDKNHIPFKYILLANVGISVGGLILTVLGNYFSEQYTLEDIDSGLKKRAERVGEMKDYITDEVKKRAPRRSGIGRMFNNIKDKFQSRKKNEDFSDVITTTDP